MIQNRRLEKEGHLTGVKDEADGRAQRQKDLFAFFEQALAQRGSQDRSGRALSRFLVKPGTELCSVPLHVQRCVTVCCECSSANFFVLFPAGFGLPVCTWTAL